MARKTYQGEKNNKSRTMTKLIHAVGHVLEQKGYTGLTIANIATAAGVDRKLISVYFGDVQNLIGIYIKDKDYWAASSACAMKSLTEATETSSRQCLEDLLLNQLEHLSTNEEMQKVILWQISQNLEMMEHVTQTREQINTLCFSTADRELKDKNVDLRAIASLLFAGIYYLVLHTKTTTSTFCEIDLTTDEGMGRIKNMIKKILENTYS